MPWKALEFVVGLVLTGVALTDVFGSVVAPGRTGGVRMGAYLRRAMMPVLRCRVVYQGGDAAQNFLGGAAAFLLMALLLVWILALLAGFALMAHALGDDFRPPLHNFGEAAFQVGSAMMTLGLSGHTASGLAQPVMFLAGFAGLAVVTLTLTFIISVQQGLERREAVVFGFTHLAGPRPCGLNLLRTVAELELGHRLGDYFNDWSAWCADVAYSHSAHPVLAFFRSHDRDNDWLATLGAMLDAAALVAALVEEGPRGEAHLLLRAGGRLAHELCALSGLHPTSPLPISLGDAGRLAAVLRGHGYRVESGPPACETLTSLRGRYAGHIAALTDYFSVRPPLWIAPATEESAVQRA